MHPGRQSLVPDIVELGSTQDLNRIVTRDFALSVEHTHQRRIEQGPPIPPVLLEVDLNTLVAGRLCARRDRDFNDRVLLTIPFEHMGLPELCAQLIQPIFVVGAVADIQRRLPRKGDGCKIEHEVRNRHGATRLQR